MKLVDILARELKVWPCAWTACSQESNGMIAGFKSGELIFDDLSGWNNAARDAYMPLSRDAAGKQTMADDWRTTIVTRAQWQAAVDALKAEKVVEWRRGELPPVGTICEHAPGGSSDDWYQVEIIEHRRFNDAPYLCAVFVTHNDVSFSSHESFRPIRTPEQIAAEEREATIKEMVYGACGCDPGDGATTAFILCGLIYDAGYRKFEIVDN